MDLLDEILELLIAIDDALMRVDTNTAVKKTHEGIAKIKKAKGVTDNATQ